MGTQGSLKGNEGGKESTTLGSRRKHESLRTFVKVTHRNLRHALKCFFTVIDSTKTPETQSVLWVNALPHTDLMYSTGIGKNFKRRESTFLALLRVKNNIHIV